MTIISYFYGRAEGTGKMHPEQLAFLLLPQTASQSSCKQFCESESQFPFPPPPPFLHLNYQRAATLLEIGDRQTPASRWLHFLRPLRLFAGLPPSHCCTFRPFARRSQSSFSPPSECERRSKSIPFLISSRCAVDRRGGEREEATLLMMEEMLSHLVFSLYLAHLGLCDNISIDPNKPAPANLIMTEM